MHWDLLLVQVLNGLQLGLLLFLLAAGLTLIFGIMDFINLAHGSFYMLGAYFCASWLRLSGSLGWAVVVALLGVFAVGAAVEWVIARRLYRREHLEQVLVTFGLILVFDTTVHFFWGAEGTTILLPRWLDGQVVLGTVVLPRYRLVLVGCGLLLALGLYVLVAKTRVGMLIRAGASNRTMVMALGVNIGRLYLLVFGLGAALAGFAGLLITPITQASIGMGNQIIISAFVVVVVGGIGSVKGAFYAALLLGFIDTLGRAYLDGLLKLYLPTHVAEGAAPALSAMSVYILMAVVLAFRPQGLFPPPGARR